MKKFFYNIAGLIIVATIITIICFLQNEYPGYQDIAYIMIGIFGSLSIFIIVFGLISILIKIFSIIISLIQDIINRLK